MNKAIDHKTYTYADYITFPEGEPVEIIDGHISAMAPAPSRVHQEIISELVTALNNYIKANKGDCKVYPALFDVMLTKSKNISKCKNVVQPDISVICDKSKLTDKGCVGAPDFIVEIVSPFNPSNDYVRKLSLYEQYKVKEYWIVNPITNAILVYSLTDKGYDSPIIYTFADKIKVNIYDNLEIDFNSFDL